MTNTRHYCEKDSSSWLEMPWNEINWYIVSPLGFYGIFAHPKVSYYEIVYVSSPSTEFNIITDVYPVRLIVLTSYTRMQHIGSYLTAPSYFLFLPMASLLSFFCFSCWYFSYNFAFKNRKAVCLFICLRPFVLTCNDYARRGYVSTSRQKSVMIYVLATCTTGSKGFHFYFLRPWFQHQRLLATRVSLQTEAKLVCLRLDESKGEILTSLWIPFSACWG